MGKRKQKKGGKAPKRPVQQPAASPPSSEDEAEVAEIKALLARVEALEKEVAEREAGRGDGGAPSTAVEELPAPLRRSTRPNRGNKMFRTLSSRVQALEVTPPQAGITEGMPTDRPSNQKGVRLSVQEQGSVSAAPQIEAGEMVAPVNNPCVEVWGDSVGNAQQSTGQSLIDYWAQFGAGPQVFQWGAQGDQQQTPWAPPPTLPQGYTQQGQFPGQWQGNIVPNFPSPYSLWGPHYQPHVGSNLGPAPERPPSSYGPIALPLGGHLALAVKEKIWRGEYVDLFSLLQTEPEPLQRVGDPVRDMEQVRKRKVERNFTNWLYGYSIFMAVVLQMQPGRATALVKYQDIIHRAFREYSGTAWSTYDEHFRLRASHDPALDWRIPQWELWVQIVVPSRPTWGDRSDSGHIISRNSVAVSRAAGGTPGVQSTRACFEFNSSGRCTRAGCNFAHACGVCGAKHGAVYCPKVIASRSAGRGGGPPGKKGGNPPPPGGGNKGANAD